MWPFQFKIKINPFLGHLLTSTKNIYLQKTRIFFPVISFASSILPSFSLYLMLPFPPPSIPSMKFLRNPSRPFRRWKVTVAHSHSVLISGQSAFYLWFASVFFLSLYLPSVNTHTNARALREFKYVCVCARNSINFSGPNALSEIPING